MGTRSDKCAASNTVGSFCDCMAEDKSADPAAKGFCDRAKAGKQVTGDELVELKKALKDLDEEDDGGCCEC